MATLKLGRGLGAISRRALSVRKEFSTLVPLEDEFPGLPSLTPEAAKATSASVTTLSSGLTIVTEGASTTSTVTLTFPKAGSASESMGEQGASLVNKNLNFRSGSGISTLMITRTIEDEGSTPFTTLTRYGASLGYTVAPDKAVGLLPLLATDCSFESWDVRDAKAVSKTECAVASESAQVVLTENLYAAAYGPQSTAGRSLYYTDVSTDAIKAFRGSAYGLSGAILTATGVKDHSAFCTEAESMMADAPVGTSDAPAPVTYLGGESRVSAPSAGYAHVALAFESPTSSVVTSVLKCTLDLLGLGAGVSAFSTKGLVGLYAGGEPSAAMIDSMCAVATGTVSPDIVKRAKSLAKAEALFALDGGSKSLAEAMTAAVLETGSFTSPKDVAAAYDAVTEQQVTAALQAMLKSNPSLAAIGDISVIPYHATVAARFS